MLLLSPVVLKNSAVQFTAETPYCRLFYLIEDWKNHMNIITDSIKNEKEYSSLISAVFSETSSKNPHSISVTGLCEGARISLLMSVARDCRARFGRGILTIFPDEKNCAKMYSACRESGISAYIYPFRDFIFHNMTFSHELEYERIGVLSAILRGELRYNNNYPGRGASVHSSARDSCVLRYETVGRSRNIY